MRYLLVLLGLLASGTAQAIDCRENPDCALMGYSTQTDPNCLENGYIACPFDTAYKKCVNYKCEAWGFTASDKSSWCAEVATCPTDKNFTLCQKACIATKYEELKDLASSGKCKLITMKNDITIPLNQSITLAENTVIDGGGHTLTSTGNQAEHIVMRANNNTGLKNIKIRHTMDNLEESGLLEASGTDNITLENMDILISSDDDTTLWSAVFRHGTYNISGKFALDIEVKKNMVGFFGGTYNFTDAQVSFKGNRATIADTVYLTFTNATIQDDTSESLFMAGHSVTFQNSEANLKGNYLFHANYQDLSLILEEGANVRLELSSLYPQYNKRTASITLKGTAEKPSVLSMTYSNAGDANIEATNSTDTLILNGVTYHPKQAGTTKLSEIPTSTNWISENP